MVPCRSLLESSSALQGNKQIFHWRYGKRSVGVLLERAMPRILSRPYALDRPGGPFLYWIVTCRAWLPFCCITNMVRGRKIYAWRGLYQRYHKKRYQASILRNRWHFGGKSVRGQTGGELAVEEHFHYRYLTSIDIGEGIASLMAARIHQYAEDYQDRKGKSLARDNWK
jgi:hypothetical protein